jgi:anion-transporting  ArsA/GET3 family ATPase
MNLDLERHRLVVVVGSGGVGKTTLAASLALNAARGGRDTLVMTFDPSLRLKDALGVGDDAREHEVRVKTDTPGALHASLLDAKRTFDRLVERHAPDPTAAERILHNRFYEHLAGSLTGILEYMAVERLYEVAAEERYANVILDTPPTRQALDFLGAPERIVSFLDSGAIEFALRPWFDEGGHLRAASWLGFMGKHVESFFDRVAGLGLLRDMAEFFQAFGPLYAGFRERALKVRELLRSPETVFVLVAGAGSEQIPDTMFFARRLEEAGYRLGPVVVNRVHPRVPPRPDAGKRGSPFRESCRLFHWLGERDQRGLVELQALLGGRALTAVGLRAEPPTDLTAMEDLAVDLVPAMSTQDTD